MFSANRVMACILFLGVLGGTASAQSIWKKIQQKAQQAAQQQNQHPQQSSQAPQKDSQTSGTSQSTQEEPWTPPTAGATTPSKAAGPLDPAKLPDIQGIHPGITVAQANQVIAHLAPGNKLIWYNAPMTLPHSTIPVGHVTASGAVELPYDYIDLGANGKLPKLQLVLEATKPPNQEHIWHIGLRAQRQHIDRAVLLAALRKKYGKELAATDQHDLPTTDDGQMKNLWWMYDEQGQLQSAKPSLVNGSPNGCGDPGALTTSYFTYSGGGGSSSTPKGAGSNPACMWVGVRATLQDIGNIIEYYNLVLWDAPLSVRDDRVTDAWLNTELQKARAASAQKAKEAKPSL